MEATVNKTLFSNISVVLYVGKFLGYIPVSSKGTGNNFTISTSRRWMFFGWILLCFLIFWMIYAHNELTKKTPSTIYEFGLIKYSSYLEMFVAILIPSISTIVMPLRMKNLYKILASLDQVDRILPSKKTRSSISENGVLMVFWVSVLCWLTLTFDSVSWYNLSDGKLSFLSHFTYRLPNFFLQFYATLVQLYFCQIAYVIQARLKKLNDHLLSLEYTPEKSKRLAVLAATKKNSIAITNSVDYDGMEQAVRNIVVAHGKIYNAVYHVNKVFGFSMLVLQVILLGCMLNFVLTPFYFYLKLRFKGDMLYAHFICELLWVLELFAKIVLLVDPCGKCSDQINGAQFLVRQHRASTSISEKVKFQLEILSEQLADYTMDFSILGICTINRGMLASITGAITTYLVIMFQFEM